MDYKNGSLTYQKYESSFTLKMFHFTKFYLSCFYVPLKVICYPEKYLCVENSLILEAV